MPLEKNNLSIDESFEFPHNHERLQFDEPEHNKLSAIRKLPNKSIFMSSEQSSLVPDEKSDSEFNEVSNVSQYKLNDNLASYFQNSNLRRVPQEYYKDLPDPKKAKKFKKPYKMSKPVVPEVEAKDHPCYKLIKIITSRFKIREVQLIRSLDYAVYKNHNVFEITNEIVGQAVNHAIYEFYLEGSSEETLETYGSAEYFLTAGNPSEFNKDIMLNYKIEHCSQSNEFGFKNSIDRRRSVLTENGLFKYSLNFCHSKHCPDFDKCSRAKTKNEYNYHPLYYKARFCKKRDCNDKFCYYGHKYSWDFRMLFDFHDESIKEVIMAIEAEELFSDIPKLEEKLCDAIPIKFDLATYKVKLCPFQSMCPSFNEKYNHVCYNYHDEFDRRRSPLIYPLKNKECPYIFKNGKFMSTIKCRYVYN